MQMAVKTEFENRIGRAWQLLPAYSYLENVPFEDVKTLAETLLDLKGFDNKIPCGRSALNADQAPLQLCITLSPYGIKSRLIADPASDDLQSSSRFSRALTALKNILGYSQSQDIEHLVMDMLDEFGPDRIPAKKFEHGVFWLAAAACQKGMATYLDTSVYSCDTAWDKAEHWLFNITQNSNLITKLELLKQYCWISSLGIEGHSKTQSKIKLYLRTYKNKNIPAGLLGNMFPSLDILGTSGCFQILMRDIGISTQDIFYNIGIHPTSGELIDIKIDIAGAGLKLDHENANDIVLNCCKALKLEEAPIDLLLKEYNLCISFIGVGVGLDKVPRLNIYLKGNV